MAEELERSTIGNKNKHIDEYLSYYASFPHSPRFAVMLNGAWGIGKTFLIKRFLEAHKKSGRKSVLVSLYGLTSLDDIDDALFRSIYPILNSTTAKVMGRTVKTAMKYFRVDDAVNIKEFLNKFNADLYVFDDLERFEGPINKVLGYINEFVEHDGCKVIILANESEIGNAEEYRRRREKIIGKTLEVQSAFDEAITYFLSEIDDLDTRKFFEANSSDIASIYHLSELNNLRILQQTMWDFERFYVSLDAKHRENRAAMLVLLRMLVVFSFEIKAGRIEADDIADRRISWIVTSKAEVTRLRAASLRYPGIELGDTILSDETLTDILVRGIINKDKICVSLNSSSYFVRVADEPAWRTVWFAFERTDEEFAAAFPKLEKQFSSRDFKVGGELLHVFGLRLWLSTVGVLGTSRADIVAECKQYIDDLYMRGSLERVTHGLIDESGISDFDGLGIREPDSEEYQELYRYLKQKRMAAEQERYPVQAAELMREMEADSEVFLRRLTLTSSGDNLYYDIPILAAIDPDTFVSVLLNQHPAKQRRIFLTFRLRYEHGGLDHKLRNERAWLTTVRDKLLLAAESMPPMARYRVVKNVERSVDLYI